MYYQEITIVSDPEISPYHIWSKLYMQLHIALADIWNQHQINTIGVSFPEYRQEKSGYKIISTLGKKLRVFAQEQSDLEKLNLTQWLERLDDYVHIKSIRPVGDKATEYLIVRRYQYKNPIRKAKEYAQRHHIDFQTALKTLPKNYKQGKTDLPYIQLHSESTGKQKFRLSIIQETTATASQGTFNRYGMNGMDNEIATVPNW